MKRRQLLKTAATGIAASQLPTLALAKSSSNITFKEVWGAPVAPTTLLGIAAKQGTLQQSISYQVKVWKTPDQLRAGVANGSMPVTMVPSYVSANFSTRGKDVVLANIMTFGLLQIVAIDHVIPTMSDLVGKKIVMPFKNDMPDLVLQILCKNAGVDFAALDIQYVSTPPEAMAMFLKQRAEVALLPEPLASAAILKSKKSGKNAIRAMDLQQQWGKVMNTKPRIPQAGMQIDRVFYKQNQDSINLLLADIQQAATWANNNIKAAADIASMYLPIPKPIMSAALPHAYLTGTPTSEIVDEILFFYEQMYQLNPKIIGGKMPSKTLFNI